MGSVGAVARVYPAGAVACAPGVIPSPTCIMLGNTRLYVAMLIYAEVRGAPVALCCNAGLRAPSLSPPGRRHALSTQALAARAHCLNTEEDKHNYMRAWSLT